MTVVPAQQSGGGGGSSGQALVSEAPERLRPKRKDLLAHQNVLSEAGAGGPLLPMRFGSVAPDDASVTGVLAERAEHYRERLKNFARFITLRGEAEDGWRGEIRDGEVVVSHEDALAEEEREPEPDEEPRDAADAAEDVEAAEAAEDDEYLDEDAEDVEDVPEDEYEDVPEAEDDAGEDIDEEPYEDEHEDEHEDEERVDVGGSRR
ncbi:GvpL/GvpF family gas vesicle protein [Streptomyces phaeolivaceus]|uniref:GvpL/GvpF family gas vesicle protein n=1 Tax=Streptomyces phaeolivaceus TaxID=2653200 RepID=UPI00186A4496|nr:GvpL/GvpF family gas vesicle protein [Streptomyces phaeolivaceus]